MYDKDRNEAKYKLLINKRENYGLNHFNDPKAFTEHSSDMDDIWRKLLVVSDDMITDMVSNKKPNLVVTELFIRGRKLNITLAFITEFYFSVPKSIRLTSTHYFIMKIPNKQELPQIAFNQSSDTEFEDFMNFYKKSTA